MIGESVVCGHSLAHVCRPQCHFPGAKGPSIFSAMFLFSIIIFLKVKWGGGMRHGGVIVQKCIHVLEKFKKQKTPGDHPNRENTPKLPAHMT